MIGVFDSGVGGLYALRELRRHLPEADFAYFGDTRNLPYGEKTSDELLLLSRRSLDFLTSLGADCVLAACGTASSVALPHLAPRSPVPLYGILDALAEEVGRAYVARGGEIAVLGTTATVRAGALTEKIRRFTTHAPLHTLACPAFVPMAETGYADREHPNALRQAADALAPLAHLDVRVVALGCTHFSCLQGLISALLPRALCVDGATVGAAALARRLTPAQLHGRGECLLFTSGDTHAFSRAAAAILGEVHPVSPLPRRAGRTQAG